MTETLRQAAEKLNSSNNILILLPPTASPDSTAAGLALHAYFKRLEKDVVIVAVDGNLNQRVNFLSGYDEILREFNITKSFVIDISTKKTNISELSYKKETDKLSIYLKPTTGQFLPEDVAFRTSKFPHDAIITIGTAALDGLGDFYSKHAELFFETPIINIDFRGSNQNFGQFNLVNLNASSHSEIAFDLVNEMEKELIDSVVATSLLAGIISETNSFQHSRTTPQAFLKASQLVSLGGNQQDIINKMFKNKSMGFLKLWGRVLARLKHDELSFTVHSAVSKMDLEKSGASDDDTNSILKEMLVQLSFAKVFVFLKELDSHSTEVQIAYPASLNYAKIFSEYSPSNLQPQSIRFIIPKPLTDTESEVLEIVKKEAVKLA